MLLVNRHRKTAISPVVFRQGKNRRPSFPPLENQLSAFAGRSRGTTAIVRYPVVYAIENRYIDTRKVLR